LFAKEQLIYKIKACIVEGKSSQFLRQALENLK